MGRKVRIKDVDFIKAYNEAGSDREVAEVLSVPIIYIRNRSRALRRIGIALKKRVARNPKKAPIEAQSAQ